MLHKQLPGLHDSAGLHSRKRAQLTFWDSVLHRDRSDFRAFRRRIWVCRGCGGCSKSGLCATLDVAGGNNTGIGACLLSLSAGCSRKAPLASGTWMFATCGIGLGFLLLLLLLLPFDGVGRWCGRFLGIWPPLCSPPPVLPVPIACFFDGNAAAVGVGSPRCCGRPSPSENPTQPEHPYRISLVKNTGQAK